MMNFQLNVVPTAQYLIIFKLCAIVYQIISYGEASYLFSVLSPVPKPRVLRSSDFHLFSVPRIKTHAETRAFSVTVPTLWNSLPGHDKTSNSIVSFRHHLKTHLFNFAYPSCVFTASDHLLMEFASYLDYEIAYPLY